MAEQKLVASVRQESGKGVARKLRADGRVPAVLYGQGADPIAMSVDARELSHLLHAGGANVLVDLVVDGREHLAMPREIQRDHIKGRYWHVDFLAVSRTEKITVDVPIRINGEAAGVKLGGVLEHHLWEVSVECFPTDVPEAIDIDVSPLDIGDSIKVGDLTVPDGGEITSNPEDSVVAVQQPQARVELDEAEAAEAADGAEAAEEAGGATADEASNTADQQSNS
jgi:large subunit ribosomal protein L25